MKKALIDTSIIIDFLRRKDKTNSLFWKYLHNYRYEPVFALITISELWAGKSMEKKEVLATVEEIIKKAEIIYPDLSIAKMAGELARKTNYKMSLQDLEIAATAKIKKLPLLTLNKSHFKSACGLGPIEPKSQPPMLRKILRPKN